MLDKTLISNPYLYAENRLSLCIFSYFHRSSVLLKSLLFYPVDDFSNVQLGHITREAGCNLDDRCCLKSYQEHFLTVNNFHSPEFMQDFDCRSAGAMKSSAAAPDPIPGFDGWIVIIDLLTDGSLLTSLSHPNHVFFRCSRKSIKSRHFPSLKEILSSSTCFPTLTLTTKSFALSCLNIVLLFSIL